MIGAIAGDIVGSVYEWHNLKTKEFPLFRDDCFFTDDTVMTCAVAQGLMNGGSVDDFLDAIKTFGRRYPDAGYGSRFGSWLLSDSRQPYGSFGNGSAMRVSACGWAMNCGFFARTGAWPMNGLETAKRSAAVTHNHPEGIRGAAAVTDAIFICRLYAGRYEADYSGVLLPTIDDCKRWVRERVTREYSYDLHRTLDEIRPSYAFDETCRGTVPQAITAFLESTDFEDALRNAVSLGGDSDTLAAITGSIAEAAYGVPAWIEKKALSYLDAPLRAVVSRWQRLLHGGVQPDG